MKTEEMFARNVPGTIEILKKKTVAIAGCGGLGSNVALALTRAGIGKLHLADFDTIEISNLNRQAYFLSDVGKQKVQALATHLQNINPNIELTLFDKKLEDSNVAQFFDKADLLIEAFDLAESKHWLIDRWCRLNSKPVIGASGLAGLGKFDELKISNAGQIYLCGDQSSDMSQGLCSARVAIVANMQANCALELLTKGEKAAL